MSQKVTRKSRKQSDESQKLKEAETIAKEPKIDAEETKKVHEETNIQNGNNGSDVQNNDASTHETSTDSIKEISEDGTSKTETDQNVEETQTAVHVESENELEPLVLSQDDVLEKDEQAKEETVQVDSLDALSTCVCTGNDSTKFDLQSTTIEGRSNETTNKDEEEDIGHSRFFDNLKSRPVGENIRLSARRSIRSVKSCFLNDGGYKLHSNGSDNKRKRQEDEDSFESKRSKRDLIMNYFSYPFARKDLPASTPTLTGYKSAVFDDSNVSKIDVENTEDGKNKWCSIM